MSAPNVKGSFAKQAGVGLLMLTMAAMPFAAANDAQAQQPVQITQSVQFAANPARGDNILSRAGGYSQNREVIGVAISVGADIPKHVTLQQVGERVQQELRKFGTDSEYFIHKNPDPNAGTSLMYFVNGSAWSNAMSYREGINKARDVSTDALFTFSHNKTKTLAATPGPQAALQH